MSTNQGGSTFDLVYRHSTDPYKIIHSVSNRGGILDILKNCQEYSIFVDMIYKSGYSNLIENPLSQVSVFAPRNSVFMNISDSQIDILKSVDIRTFVGYHISTDVLTREDMLYTRRLVNTKSDVMLEINGMALEPKIGPVSKSLTGTPSQWVISSVQSSIRVNKGVLNIIDLPIIINM